MKGGLKFNIVLKSWKFCGIGDDCTMKGKSVVGHHVCFYIIIKDGTKGKPSRKGESKGKLKSKKRAKRFALGGKSTVVLPDELEVDGQIVSLDAAPTIVSIGGVSQFKICFPRFNDTVIYDPLAQQDGDYVADHAPSAFISFTLVTFTSFISLLIATF